MADNHRMQLDVLEEEEARIMRELRMLDQEEDQKVAVRRRRDSTIKEDPDAALSQLLLECEKEVREAKGYIADEGPPLKIVRVRVGEPAPKGATFLSRPRGTGVDFTTPVTIKAYTDLIKKPIFLNQIRDKIKAKSYSSPEDYLDDMRLLARNTAAFNKGPELSWVVQHARFLLEAAEEAITARRKQFYDVEDALRTFHGNRQKATTSHAGGASGKRKRTSSIALDTPSADSKGIPGVGTAIEVYWPNYRRWFLATITERSASNVHVLYDEDNTDQWVNLEHGLKWRVRNTRNSVSGVAKSKRVIEPPVPKKRKGASATPHTDSAQVIAGGSSGEDLQSMKVEVFSKLDDIKESLADLVSNHLDKIDAKLMRSDALQRVLIAVQDCHMVMEEKFTLAEARSARIERTLDILVKKLDVKDGKQVIDSVAEKITEEIQDPASFTNDGSNEQAENAKHVDAGLSPNKPTSTGAGDAEVPVEVIDIDVSPDKPRQPAEDTAAKNVDAAVSDPSPAMEPAMAGPEKQSITAKPSEDNVDGHAGESALIDDVMMEDVEPTAPVAVASVDPASDKQGKEGVAPRVSLSNENSPREPKTSRIPSDELPSGSKENFPSDDSPIASKGNSQEEPSTGADPKDSLPPDEAVLSDPAVKEAKEQDSALTEPKEGEAATKRSNEEDLLVEKSNGMKPDVVVVVEPSSAEDAGTARSTEASALKAVVEYAKESQEAELELQSAVELAADGTAGPEKSKSVEPSGPEVRQPERLKTPDSNANAPGGGNYSQDGDILEAKKPAGDEESSEESEDSDDSDGSRSDDSSSKDGRKNETAESEGGDGEVALNFVEATPLSLTGKGPSKEPVPREDEKEGPAGPANVASSSSDDVDASNDEGHGTKVVAEVHDTGTPRPKES